MAADDTASCQGGVALELGLYEATAALLYLRPLGQRDWWRLRALSKPWCRLLDGSSGGEHKARSLGSRGLLSVLVHSQGPLRTANQEVDFAGCMYAAVHHNSLDAMRRLLEPLTCADWARRSFAMAVAREALEQAAIQGNAPGCEAILASDLRLCKADADAALQAAEDWDFLDPAGSCTSTSVSVKDREAVSRVLQAVV